MKYILHIRNGHSEKKEFLKVKKKYHISLNFRTIKDFQYIRPWIDLHKCSFDYYQLDVSISDHKLFFQGNPVTVHVLQTLVLYECEKHPREEDWEDSHIGDRISGILMQLISCLQVNTKYLEY